MHFVRAGWANPDGAPRSELQRVSWQRSGDALVRAAYRTLDGGDDGAVAAPVAQQLRDLGLRYRLPDGSWAESFQSTPTHAFPAAVELTLTISARPPVVVVLAFPAAGVPAPGMVA